MEGREWNRGRKGKRTGGFSTRRKRRGGGAEREGSEREGGGGGELSGGEAGGGDGGHAVAVEADAEGAEGRAEEHPEVCPSFDPVDAQHLRDLRLVHAVLDQPRRHAGEVLREARAGRGPWNGGDVHAVLVATHARNPGADEDPERAQLHAAPERFLPEIVVHWAPAAAFGAPAELEHFAKMCGHKVRRCDILSHPNLLRGWKPHLRKPPAKWLQ